MDEPRARAIFKNLTTRIYSKPQKLEAISIVVTESKLNKLTKEELLAAIKWLISTTGAWPIVSEIETEDENDE